MCLCGFLLHTAGLLPRSGHLRPAFFIPLALLFCIIATQTHALLIPLGALGTSLRRMWPEARQTTDQYSWSLGLAVETKRISEKT